MIHSFSCKNFYSFKEFSKLSFEVSEKKSKDTRYVKSDSGSRISLIEAVIGPNASGKTNLLKVLPFLKWLIVDSYGVKPEAEIPVKQYVLNKDKPVELSVTFEIKGLVYKISFILNAQVIIQEKLEIISLSKSRTTTKRLYIRRWDKIHEKYIFKGNNYKLPKSFQNAFRKNASVISTAIRLNHRQSVDIGKYWDKVWFNVDETGTQEGSGGDVLLREVLAFMGDNDKYRIKAEKILSKFDLGLSKIVIDKIKKGKEFLIDSQAIHKYKGNEFALDIRYESSGTKQLLILMGVILQVLNEGGIAILDEIDINLHPDMVNMLYELFIRNETNPKRAQLLFSTHSILILNRLNKNQIVFTEMNPSGYTETWRLDEMKGIRPDENIFAKYISGAYGAIPSFQDLDG